MVTKSVFFSASAAFVMMFALPGQIFAASCGEKLPGAANGPAPWSSNPDDPIWRNACYIDLGQNQSRELLARLCESVPGYISFSPDRGSGHNTCVFRSDDDSSASSYGSGPRPPQRQQARPVPESYSAPIIGSFNDNKRYNVTVTMRSHADNGFGRIDSSEYTNHYTFRIYNGEIIVEEAWWASPMKVPIHGQRDVTTLFKRSGGGTDVTSAICSGQNSANSIILKCTISRRWTINGGSWSENENFTAAVLLDGNANCLGGNYSSDNLTMMRGSPNMPHSTIETISSSCR